MNATVKPRITSSPLALMFVCGLGTGYALLKSIKTETFESSSIVLICACVAMMVRIGWKTTSKK